MSIHHKTQDYSSQVPVAPAQVASPGQGVSGGGIDPLILAFYYLLQASNISSESAIIHAKMLNQNAEAQLQLNNEIGNLPNNMIPELRYKNTWDVHVHLTWRFWKYGGFFFYCTRTQQKIFLNRSVVDLDKAFSQNIGIQRQRLTDQMAVLQQNAQISETQVNSIAGEAMQAGQEGTSLMEALKDLTFKAALTRAPQN